MFELTQIMRQKDDAEFANLLNRLREGKQTTQDINCLESRIIPESDTHLYHNTVHLYPTNNDVEVHNNIIYHTSPESKIEVHAVDSILGDLTKEVKSQLQIPTDPSRTCGLHTTVRLTINLPYDITCNVDVDDGITNGSECTLKMIDYRQNTTSTTNPSILWVYFKDRQIGQSARNAYKQYYKPDVEPLWTPIFAIKRQFHITKNYIPVIRCQFPVVIGAAKTIHKSQGSSVDAIVVQMPKRKICHMHYVALSRVRTLNGLYIKHLWPEKIAVDMNVINEMNRLRNEAPIKLCYKDPKTVLNSAIKAGFLNARSLHGHFHEARSAIYSLGIDVIAFAESRLCSQDNSINYSVENYVMYRNDQTAHYNTNAHPPHGLAVYVKADLVSGNVIHHCYSSPHFEASFISMDTVQYVFLYRSPSCSMTQFFTKLRDLIAEIDTRSPLIIAGDFNVDAQNNNFNNIIKNIEAITNCKQIVNEITTDYDSTIDLAFTNIHMLQSSTIESIWSDHKLLFLYKEQMNIIHD